MVDVATLGISVESGGATAGAERAAGSLRKMSAEARKSMAEFDKLDTQLDLVAASERQLQAQTDRLQQAQQKGLITQKQLNAALLQAQQRHTALARDIAKAKSATDAMEIAQGRVNQSLGAGRAQIQNVAFQVGDFATQVGAGTSASVALAQQLPQLLGAFGALGAVAGAVVAIGVPLAAAFFNVGDASEALAENLEDLEESTQAALEAAGDLGDRWDDTQARLYDVSGIVLAQQALLTLKQTAEGLAESTERGFLSGFLNDFTFGLVGAQQGVEGLQEQFNLTEEAAYEVIFAFERMRDAGPEEISQEVDQLVRYLIEAAGGVENLTQETISFILQLVEVQKNAEIGAAILAEFAPILADASASADGLSGALARVRSQAELAAIEFTKMQALRSRFGNDEDAAMAVGFAVNPANLKPRSERSEKLGGPSTRKGRGGGGSDPAKEIDKLQQAYERLRGSMDPVFKAQTEYNDAVEVLDKLLKAGKITQDEYNDTLAMAKERLDEVMNGADEAAKAMEQFTEQLDRAMSLEMNAVDGAKALNSAFSDFLFDPFSDGVMGMVSQFNDAIRRIVSDALAARATNAILGLLGGLGGGGGAAGGIGAMPGGLSFPFFDTGGAIPVGKTGIVGEYGPEIVKATPGGAMVTSRVDSNREMRDGNGGVAIAIFDNRQQADNWVAQRREKQKRVVDMQSQGFRRSA